MTEIPNKIVSVLLTNNKTGKKVELERREGSYCHFIPDGERGSFGYYQLRFRLDWKDLDADGNPTLDADLFDMNGEQLDKDARTKLLGEQHHTVRIFDAGTKQYIYRFVKSGVNTELLVETVNQIHQTGSAWIVK